MVTKYSTAEKIISLMPIGVVITDLDGRILHTNAIVDEMFGNPTGEAIGRFVTEFIAEEDVPRAFAAIGEIIKKGSYKGFECIGVTKQGSKFTLIADGTSLTDAQNMMRILITVRDITELKRAEEERKRVLIKRAEIIDAMADPLVVLNLDGKITAVNVAFTKMFGRKPEDVIGKGWDEMTFRREDVGKIMKAIQEAIETGNPRAVEIVAYAKDGREIPISVAGAVTKDANGKPTNVVTTIRDITERKRAEQERAKAIEMAFLEDALASAPDGVLLHDEQARFTYLNPAFLKLVGREAKDFIGKTVSEVSPPFMNHESTKIIAERVEKRVKTGEPIVGAEAEIIDKDGKRIPVSYSAAGIRDEEGNVIGEVVFLREITERERKEI